MRNEEINVDFNVFVGDMGKKGCTNDVTPPSLELTGVESEASAAGKREIFYGAVENMELEFSMHTHDGGIYEEMGKLNDGKIVLKTALNNGELGNLKKIEIVARGQVSTLTDGNIKRGEKADAKVKMKSLHYYKKMIDGTCVCEIDKINGICKPDGKTDMLEDARNYVG